MLNDYAICRGRVFTGPDQNRKSAGSAANCRERCNRGGGWIFGAQLPAGAQIEIDGPAMVHGQAVERKVIAEHANVDGERFGLVAIDLKPVRIGRAPETLPGGGP